MAEEKKEKDENNGLGLTAEQLQKEFKEHSVADFFKKNKQMLGLTGKIRTLTTIIHEYVTNSVTWDTPTVVRINKDTQVSEIGKVCDELMEKNGFDYSDGKKVESLREFPKFEVLCFDKETNRLKFKEVKSLHRHRLEEGERLFRIKTVGNRIVETTKHHGLFSLRNGKIAEVKAEDLNVGDFIAVPRKNWIEETAGEINLLEEALKLNDSELKEFSIFGIKKLLYGNPELKNKIKAQMNKKQQQYDFYRNYMKCDRLPVRLLKILNDGERRMFYNAEVGYRHTKYHLPAKMPVTSELLQFLGLFIAEGSTRKTLASCALSFGSHEQELIQYSAQLVEKVFGFRPFIKKAHPTATNVVLPSKTVAFLLSKIIQCGIGAKNKQIPGLVFNVSEERAREFLFAYLAGDGYPSQKLFHCLREKKFQLKEKITLATASNRLALGMQYLLSALGYSYSFQGKKEEKRTVKNVETLFGKSYTIEFYLSQQNSPLNFYPLASGGITAIIEPKLKWAIGNRGQQFATYEKITSLKITDAAISEQAARFIAGDLGLLQIAEITTRIPAQGEFVYDYSVENDENFVGGFGAICLHNSLDACEEHHVLPELTVKITEIGEEHYELSVQDNGPGLTKETVGKAFGQLLAGTKFHRRIQQRGQQGIGAAGATMLALGTTGKPIQVITGDGKHAFMSELTIDSKTNQPKIIKMDDIDKPFKGTAVKARFKDIKYQRSEQGPFEYLRRTAIANPHAKVTLFEPDGTKTIFDRTSNELPPRPIEVPPHPRGMTIDELLEMSHVTKARKVSAFLKTDFDRMGEKAIEEIEKKVHFDLEKDPKKLVWEEAEEIVKAFKTIQFIAPRTDGLRPIGEERIEKSVKEIVEPEFLSVVERKPAVYQGGFAFQVETAVGFGGNAGRVLGKDEQGNETRKMEIMRFANRVPLLFDSGGCALTKAVQTVDWKRYGIKDLDNAPLTVFIHILSVHIPYTGAGKQAVADEEEVMEELRLALMDTGRKIYRYVALKKREEEKQQKRKLFMKYAAEVAYGLQELTKEKKETIEKKLLQIVLNRLKIEEEQMAKEEVPEELDEAELEKEAKKEKKEKEKKGKKKKSRLGGEEGDE